MAEAKSNILRLEAKIASDEASVEAWVEANGRDLVCVHELLERQENLASAPTQMAVADRAFAMDAWIPTGRADEVRSALKPHASLVEVEAWDGATTGTTTMTITATGTVLSLLSSLTTPRPRSHSS